MANAITRLFDSYSQAAAAVTRLEAAGVPHHDISIVGNDGDKLPHAHDRGGDGINEHEAREGAAEGATKGGLIGGGAGLLAGLGMLAIPGLGPVVAAGWLVSTAVGAAIGAAAGGATGGILGALKDAGHTEEEANVYAEGVRRGATLVSVRTGNEAHAAAAQEILNGEGGVDANVRGADYRASGWQAFDASAEPFTPEQVSAERARYAEKRSFASSGSQDGIQSDGEREEPIREGFSNPTPRFT